MLPHCTRSRAASLQDSWSTAATLQHGVQKQTTLLRRTLAHSEEKAASSSIQSPADHLDAALTFKQSHAPQSDENFDILD